MNKTLLVILILIIILVGGLIIFFPKQNQTSQNIQIPSTNTKPMNNFKNIRPPAVAGQFYPDNKDELSQTIDEFLNKTELPPIDAAPQILILPHAGYVFSGQTAAYGFKALQGNNYDNVIILGSSHNYPVQQLVIYDGDAVETPLGNVPVNKQIIEDLIKDNDQIKTDNEVHAPEHSLEVEIPFLQKVLTNDWQVVLGLINTDDLSSLKSVANSIKKILEKYPNTLVVISSDLSHYPSYNDALYSDKKIIASILTKDVQNLINTIDSIKSENRPGLDTAACGSSVIKIGMLLANQLELEGLELNYSNSGDVQEYGDKDRVVGYAAIAFLKTQKYLNQQEQQAALKLARNTLDIEFNLTEQKFEDYMKYPIFSEKRGVFVTINKDNQLRGCIGLIESTQPLGQGIIEMAKAATFNDHRFEPLTKEEFEHIEIEVSVLTPPEKINKPDKIKLGKHGVIVRSGNNSGVYLPQVATDTGWDLETFMQSLCTSKANLSADCWKDGSADIYIFEAQVFGE